MIDTHCHLNFPPLLEKINEIVEKSKKVGLTGIVVASSNLEDSKISVKLASKYQKFLHAVVGIHPQASAPLGALNLLDSLISLNHEKIVAVGETGLDWSQPPPGEAERSQKDQEELFLGQIKLAQKYGLSLIVHAREANDEIIEILRTKGHALAAPRNVKLSGAISKGWPYEAYGVFHCYSGGKKRIQKILDLGGTWYFGFDGNLTYEEGLQQVIKLIPVERIVIETDSPFLAPVPHRGETNTPVYLPLIQQKINEIFDEDLTAQILKNSRNLFKI